MRRVVLRVFLSAWALLLGGAAMAHWLPGPSTHSPIPHWVGVGSTLVLLWMLETNE